MFEHFYYKFTREQCEDLLKDKEFANRKGYLGLKIENLTDKELSETFNVVNCYKADKYSKLKKY